LNVARAGASAGVGRKTSRKKILLAGMERAALYKAYSRRRGKDLKKRGKDFKKKKIKKPCFNVTTKERRTSQGNPG